MHAPITPPPHTTTCCCCCCCCDGGSMLHETGTAAIGEMTPIRNTRDRELSTPLATERGRFLLRSNKSREKQEQPNSDEKESPRRIWTDSGVNAEEEQGKLWCCSCTDNMAEMCMCACARVRVQSAEQRTSTLSHPCCAFCSF